MHSVDASVTKPTDLLPFTCTPTNISMQMHANTHTDISISTCVCKKALAFNHRSVSICRLPLARITGL